MKILWVKAGGLVPPDTGGKIRSYNILRKLARQNSVTFFSFYSAHNGDVHPTLREVFDQVVCVPLSLPKPKSSGELRDYIIRLFSSEPYGITKYCRPEVRRRLNDLLKEETFDVIVCDFLSAAGVVPWDWPGPKILFTHNVEAVIWRRHYEIAANPLWKAISWVEWRRMEAAERRFFDRWTAKQRALSNDQSAVDRGGPPPTRDIPGQAFSRPPPMPQNEIIGLFPEPGTPR